MPVSYSGTAITWPDNSTTTSGWTGFKNRIINGNLYVSQYNGSSSTTPGSGTTYVIDRWKFVASQASKFTLQQNAGGVTPPAGFTNYLGATVASAVTIGTNDYFIIRQGIEGYNIADLAWGTASAATVILSFKVYSSLTGTFGGAISNGSNRGYPFTYTISSANTWTSISVTIPGDTTGTWGATNGLGIQLSLSLGVGSANSGTAGSWGAADYASATGATSVVGTNGATFYITGVQLERGSTASSFEYRPYGTELNLCQRYFISLNSAVTNAGDSCFAYGLTAGDATYHSLVTYLSQPMRTAPTLTINNLQLGDAWNYGITVTSLWYSNQNTPDIVKFGVRTGAGATAYRGAFLSGTYLATDSYLNMSAEL